MARPTLLLAPLQGVTDAIVRDMLSSLGGIDACVSVYARVSNQALPAEALLRSCPELRHDGKTRSGTTVYLQLLGSNAALLAQTAQNAASAGVSGIDLNFGCPMGRVNRHDGGATLLRDPARIARIVDTVRQSLPPSVSLSAKVRIGWSDPAEVTEIVRAVERGGASWITVHGRTRIQLYGGEANWEAIGRARQAVRIPIVANGDIRSPEDLRRCSEVTGCDRFMIGRGGLARPELFAILAGRGSGWWQPEQRLALLARYGERCLAFGIPEPSTIGRVKGWWRYMAEADKRVAAVFDRAKKYTSWTALRDALSGSQRF